MVSTNSIGSGFAAFVINGNEHSAAELSEDFSAIVNEVLRRLAPALQYVITKPLHESIDHLSYEWSGDGHPNEGTFAQRLKGIVLAVEQRPDWVECHYVLGSNGKLYAVVVRKARSIVGEQRQLRRFMEATGDEVFEAMAKENANALDAFFEKLSTAFGDSITQAEQRLANMKGRLYWLAEVMSRYQSTIDTPRS